MVNKIIIKDDHVILVTKKNEEVLIDIDDIDKIKVYNWHVNSRKYAVTSISSEKGQKKLYMHRVIMNTPKDMYTDHINHNTLDNRKVNLRICTPKENSRNKKKYITKKLSDYKGVSKINQKNKWKACIKVNGKEIFIGNFTDEVAAANAYNYYAIKEFGEFAELNNVDVMNKEKWESFKIKTSSKYRGVSRVGNKWVAYYCKGKNTFFIGYYSTEIDAFIKRKECLEQMKAGEI